MAPVAILDRDLLRVRHARLLIEQNQNDQAVEALRNHNFKSWEATVIIHWEETDAVRDVFALANLKKRLEELEEDKFREAEQAFRAALEPTSSAKLLQQGLHVVRKDLVLLLLGQE